MLNIYKPDAIGNFNMIAYVSIKYAFSGRAGASAEIYGLRKLMEAKLGWPGPIKKRFLAEDIRDAYDDLIDKHPEMIDVFNDGSWGLLEKVDAYIDAARCCKKQERDD